MEPELTPEEQGLVDLARTFGENEIEPVAADLDRRGEYPRDLLRRMGELGFMGGVVPEEYGGAGLRFVVYARIIEELARFDQYIAGAATSASGLRGSALMRYGTPEQKARWLAPLARGETLAGTGLTEPRSGSDVLGMETTAARNGENYVLNGSKVWIGGAGHADWFLTFATLDRSANRTSICAFVVERGTPGFETSEYSDKMAFRMSDSGELSFSGCTIPASHRVGAEGEGLRVAMSAVENGRLGVGARACGMLRRCLDEVVAYARQRTTFGRPIGEHQLIQAKIADMAIGLTNARNLLYDLAGLRDAGVARAGREAAMLKRYSTDVLMQAATDAVQVFGAYGISTAYPVERLFRDAKVLQIVEGTNEIQTIRIAQYALGYRSDT